MRKLPPRAGRLGLLALGIVALALVVIWIAGGSDSAPAPTATPGAVANGILCDGPADTC